MIKIFAEKGILTELELVIE